MDTNSLGMLAGVVDPTVYQQTQAAAAPAPQAAPTSASGGTATTQSATPSDPALQAMLDALANAGTNVPQTILDQVKQYGDQRLFFQAHNTDSFLTAANSILVEGGDLGLFLQTALQVRNVGDLDKFYRAVSNVMQKGDYDDLRRFLNVTGTVMRRGENLETWYAFSNQVLNEAPDDYEGVIFAAQTTMSYGASLADFKAMHAKLDMHGFEGRNNLVDLNRVTIAARKANLDVAAVLRLMAQEMQYEQDGRAIIDEMMQIFRLQDTRPDFNLFARIERLDSGPMTITQGESAALFCQAISSRDGLLPAYMTCWSSEELGEMGRGNYMDLSKLPPGTYHFVAKIDGGGDTAIKTVIVEPRDGEPDPDEGAVIIGGGGKPPVKGDDGNNGHGNDPGGVDPSNPGNSSGVGGPNGNQGNGNNGHGNAPGGVNPNNPGNSSGVGGPNGNQGNGNSGKVKGDDGNNGHGNDPGKIDPSNPGKSGANKTQSQSSGLASMLQGFGLGGLASIVTSMSLPNLTQMLASLDMNSLSSVGSALHSISNLMASTPATGREDISPWEKMWRLYAMHEDNLPATAVYEFIDKKLGRQAVVNFLNAQGATGLAQQYANRSVTAADIAQAQLADPQLYDKSTAFLRSVASADEVAQFLSANGANQSEVTESLWLLGYRDQAPVVTTPNNGKAKGADGNNGHGNDPGKVDPSNPGKSKAAERAAAEANESSNGLDPDAEARIRANLKLQALSQEEIDREAEILFLLREIKSLNEKIAALDELIKSFEAFQRAKNKDKQAAYDQFRQYLELLLSQSQVGPDEEAILSKITTSLPKPEAK